MKPWPTVTLHDISRPKQWKTINKADLRDEGYPVYGANGVIGYYDDYNHEHPTVLIGCRGSCGSVHVSAPKAWVTGNAMALDDLDTVRVDQRFLVYALRADGLQAAVTGSSQPQITRTSLRHVRIPLPPIEEQRRIAAVLDAADALRAKRREALAKLDTLTQAIFIDMFGSPGDNPRGWPVSPLIELVDPERPITYGILKPGDDIPDGVPYVRVVDMAGGRVLGSGLRRTTHEIAHQYRRSTLAEGDLLLSIRGHVGRMAQVRGELAGANITQDTARLAIVGAQPTYVLACLQAEESQRWMANFTKGAAVRGINLTDVKKLPVPVPPAELQRAFSERAARAAAQAGLCGKAQARLDGLFASLQQRAFRGEL